MLVNIESGIRTITNFIQYIFGHIQDAITAIPRFADYISDLIQQLPTFLVPTLSAFLIVAVFNKIFSAV